MLYGLGLVRNDLGWRITVWGSKIFEKSKYSFWPKNLMGNIFQAFSEFLKTPKRCYKCYLTTFIADMFCENALKKIFFFLVKILKIFFFDPKNRKNFENFIKSSKNHKTLKSGFWASRTSRKRDLKNLGFSKKMGQNSMRKDSFGKIFTGSDANFLYLRLLPSDPKLEHFSRFYGHFKIRKFEKIFFFLAKISQKFLPK